MRAAANREIVGFMQCRDRRRGTIIAAATGESEMITRRTIGMKGSKVRTRSFVLVGGMAMLCTRTASADFLGIALQPYEGGDDAQAWISNGYVGLDTYRLYALFTPGDTTGASAVFSITGFPMSLNTDGAFYNDLVYGRNTPPIDYRPEMIWSAEWDTYITMGNSHQPSATATCCYFNTLTAGLSQNWSSENAGWFVTPDNAESHPPPNGKQLLGQFTVSEGSAVFGIVNIHLRDGTQHMSLEFISCPGDLDGSGDVDFGDLIAVLGAWGPCKGCPHDLDGDGFVGFSDIIAVLAAWGPCG